MPDQQPTAGGASASGPQRLPPRLGLDLAGSIFKFSGRRVCVVGSGADADFRVVHDSVAPRHARVFADGDELVVEDLGSGLPTLIGDQPVTRGFARPGDVVTFGKLRLHVVDATAIAIARASRLNRHEPAFHELVAAELARAPWFLISIAAHALVFLLLYWFLPTDPVGQAGHSSAQVLHPEAEAEVVLDDKPEEKVEVEAAERTEARQDAQTESRRFEPDARQPDAEFDPRAFEGFDATGFAASIKRGGKGSGDILDLGSDALKRGGFRGTVSKLRESGLEIVFVFDSTGSMDSVLSAAKRRIFRMVEVLHALVPTSRIGIVTYRDSGPTEEYETREVPVTNDVYRVMNFMHTIQAGGGGDFEEAVFEGLRSATSQRWLDNSRRVVVLIGDAPPHKKEEAPLRTLISGFARGEAVVHTIASAEDRRRKTPNPETKRTFEAIAQAGRGQFTMLEAEDTILTQVLALAFGAQYRRDLDEVYELVDRRIKRTDVAALDAVQRADLGTIEKALRRAVVDDEMVKAIIALKPAAVLRFLATKLGDGSFPASGRQAAAFALMQALSLRRPPIAPDDDRPLPRKQVDDLLRQIR